MTSCNLTSILSAVIRFTSEIYTGMECRSPCWATHVGSACKVEQHILASLLNFML